MASGCCSARMFWPRRTFTAAKSTTAVPAVQLKKVLSAALGGWPERRAVRHCQAQEASETRMKAAMPRDGGMTSVKRTGSMSGLFRCGRGRGLFHEEHLQEQQQEAHGNAAVGHVERRPVQRGAQPGGIEPVPVDEVDHVSAQDAVEGVADGAAEDERQRHLQVTLVGAELAIVTEYENDRDDADQVEEGHAELLARAGQYAPVRAPVLRVAVLPGGGHR